VKIPSEVRIKRGVYYAIKWQAVIDNDPECCGLCDPGEQTITLKLGMSDTEIAKTFIHEMLHAIEAEWEEPIPHRIVYTLEEGIFKVLKLNRWIK